MKRYTECRYERRLVCIRYLEENTFSTAIDLARGTKIPKNSIRRLLNYFPDDFKVIHQHYWVLTSTPDNFQITKRQKLSRIPLLTVKDAFPDGHIEWWWEFEGFAELWRERNRELELERIQHES